MAKGLYCVEIGMRDRSGWSITNSVVAMTEAPGDALHRVQKLYPEMLQRGLVRRIYRVDHVAVDWTLEQPYIIEKKSRDRS